MKGKKSMKLTVYCARQDEQETLRTQALSRGIELELTRRPLLPDNVELARGSEAVAINGASHIDGEISRSLRDVGVKYVLTRGTGFDHMDLSAIAKYGLRCANVPAYSRNAVSEYTVMVLLSLLRGLKSELSKVAGMDFSMPLAPSRELGSMTIGVFGTGLIGSQTVRFLRGFGCHVLAYTPHPRAELAGLAEYVTAEELFRRSDAIIFHCALTGQTRGIVNRESIASMKRGVYLVNSARGELMDFAAVLDALKSGQIAALATDVYPGEASFVHKKMSGSELDKVLTELVAMDNVILTPHIAFYTNTSIENISAITLDNFRDFHDTGECANELKPRK